MRLEDFLKGKRVTDLKPNEIVVETMFKALDDQASCAFEKIGMRNSLIIAFVNSAVYLRLERKTRRVEDVRVAFNRVGGKIPERSKRAEEKLRGHKLSAQGVEDAALALRSELKLSSDFRVSGEYRADVASVLFKRALNRCANMVLGGESFV